jgi:hypothetical protein
MAEPAFPLGHRVGIVGRGSHRRWLKAVGRRGPFDGFDGLTASGLGALSWPNGQDHAPAFRRTVHPRSGAIRPAAL